MTSDCRFSEQRLEGTRPVRGSGRACVDACGIRAEALRAGCDDHRIHDRPDHALGWAGLAFVYAGLGYLTFLHHWTPDAIPVTLEERPRT